MSDYPDDEEEHDEPYEEEPCDSDLVTEDYVAFWECGACRRKPVVVVGDGNDWTAAVKAYMDAENFWPNVWFQGERGGYDLLSLETGGFVR